MSKFNTVDRRASATSPVRTEPAPTGRTFEGGAGYARDEKSELFLLAVTNMVGEQTFYETAGDRDNRFRQLVHAVAVADPAWMLGMIGWLRTEANMRTASIVMAAEAVKARLDAGHGVPVLGGAFTRRPGQPLRTVEAEANPVSSRQLIAAALQRADEPGELLAYWISRYGRAIPKPVKRGVADAVARLYTEYSLLKYDTPSHAFRFADVLDLVHPAPKASWQGALFQHALDRRHGRDADVPERLSFVRLNAEVRVRAVEDPQVLLDSDLLSGAAMTWEDALSLAGDKLDKARLWEALIPSMGYMALLRNLRNFDQAGVSDKVAASVAARLADPAEVVHSRQLPMRFLSAYRAAPSLRWSYPLEQALGHCLSNIPTLTGRTLVMIDTSTSMNAGFSKDGTLKRWDAAVIFGVALAQRCESAQVVSFSAQHYSGARTKVFELHGGESLLRLVERWQAGGFFLGGGTDTAAALRQRYAGHDRVVILTDEQVSLDANTVNAAVPARTPMYTWNLAGYERGHAPSGGEHRHTFGGLTDQAFGMIPLLERHRDQAWPWLP